jgi:prevent-host-death family protein
MEPLDIFTVRDLRQRSGELLREAEEGRLTLITKHGRPAILALPFDERLLAHGVNRALALHLFEAGQVSLAQASKIASISLEEFIELLGQAGIPAVDYDPAELAQEMEVRPVRH